MSTRVLDHIIHLTPPGSIEQVSSEFRKLGFEVIPGGTHTDGLTYNALVSFADGVYLELIAFVDTGGPPPASHRWGSAQPNGWIDFANLGLVPLGDVAGVINGRAEKDGSGATYDVAKKGGRETQAGKTLQWRVTMPTKSVHGVGKLPFFCEDLTPREWRVPEPGEHVSKARGISFVKLLARDPDEFATLVAQLTTVLGIPSSTTTPLPSSRCAMWALDTPSPLPGLHTLLILEQTSADLDSRSGIHEVGIWVERDQGGQADSPYGKIVWTPIPDRQ